MKQKLSPERLKAIKKIFAPYLSCAKKLKIKGKRYKDWTPQERAAIRKCVRAKK